MKRLRPFFSYYGSKWLIAPLYPAPQNDNIIEPFAGSASYSLLHHHRQITLYDIDENICMIWDYLIKSTIDDIKRLCTDFYDLRTLEGYTQEEKTLMGFWAVKGASKPQNKKTQYSNRKYTADYKQRTIQQKEYIKHWKIKKQSYEAIKNKNATWFIDPPYQKGGARYIHNKIDYNHLAKWVQTRQGQVICCENKNATWLPFTNLTSTYTQQNKPQKELVYIKGS